MAELEKVIKGLECCILRDPDDHARCSQCSYGGNCINRLKIDALELLKAQEPVKPYIDYDGQDVWRCGSCGATLFHLSHTQADENEQNCVKFCRYCGKAVKWDD
jgi:hypothetical protein